MCQTAAHVNRLTLNVLPKVCLLAQSHNCFTPAGQLQTHMQFQHTTRPLITNCKVMHCSMAGSCSIYNCTW